MSNLNKKLEKIKQDINGYHDIVSDLRDEWFDLCDILSSEDEREDSIIRGIKSLTDSFEEDIFKSVAMIEKIKENK
tara:strand:- start:615 stop:842 length:228 start_codon:yes stop_codon:yes gene_type:complete